MSGSASGDLYSICSDLSSVISELEDIAAGLRIEFTGIGNDRCAQRISDAVSHYAYARQRLYSVDTSTVTEEYARAHQQITEG